MPEPNNDLDETALNVLVAEGLDVPTAVEASRRGGGSGSGGRGCMGVVILFVIAFAAAIILLR